MPPYPMTPVPPDRSMVVSFGSGPPRSWLGRSGELRVPFMTESAIGSVISCGRRVGTAEGKLTDKAGRVLAHGTTTCLIFQS